LEIVLNILIVSPKFHPIIGGGETYVLNSARMLAREGHVVAVATEPVDTRNISNFPFDVHEIDGLSDTTLVINISVVKLTKLIEDFNPAIIHVHGYFGLLVVGLCNYRNIPIVASIHSTPVWNQRIVGNMHSFATELQFARSVLDAAKPTLFTAANDVYADAAEKISENRVPVVTIPYPVDASHFYNQTDRSVRLDFKLAETDVLLLLPSRIIERKGIKECIFALELLPENVYVCLPAAYNPLDLQYWNYILRSDMYKKNKHRILIPDKEVNYDEMPRYYAACDIVVMPSYYEGAPVATVEAMSSGKPFIGADSQGINGFIQNRRNGLLVTKKSVVELADSIQEFLDNVGYGQKLAIQAKKDVRYLDWKQQLPLLVAEYKKAINSSKKNEIITTVIDNVS
jgi:glycosyltransferase involved in cell wall biosynthesis